jgi:protein-L-isoaspartate O-methyltransferase
MSTFYRSVWFSIVSLGVLSLGSIGYSFSLLGDPSFLPRAESADVLAQSTAPADLDVPYVPTPKSVVNEMLALAQVSKNDTLYDLGSGDGRIVISAAQRFGTRGVGIDIDPNRIAEANANARAAGVTDLVQFRQQDLFTSDFSQATVVTLYLLPSVNLELRSQLLQQLEPGTRIVSHSFDMGDWKPEQVVRTQDGSTLYAWVVPKDIPPYLQD